MNLAPASATTIDAAGGVAALVQAVVQAVVQAYRWGSDGFDAGPPPALDELGPSAPGDRSVGR